MDSNWLPGDGEWSCGARAEHQSGKLRCVRCESVYGVRCTSNLRDWQTFVSVVSPSFWYHWYHEFLNIPEKKKHRFPVQSRNKVKNFPKTRRWQKRGLHRVDWPVSEPRLPSEQQLCLWRVEPWRWKVSIFGVPLDSRNVFVKFSKFLASFVHTSIHPKCNLCLICVLRLDLPLSKLQKDLNYSIQVLSAVSATGRRRGLEMVAVEKVSRYEKPNRRKNSHVLLLNF